ncbi:MAG: hypothetical protein WC879_11905 [Melioribacteraceae bacterium]
MNNNLYWSYAKKPLDEKIIIEQTLKYSDYDELISLIKKYGIDNCKKIWESVLIPDERLRKLNHFLAKFIFRISMDSTFVDTYLKKYSKKRSEKTNELLNG